MLHIYSFEPFKCYIYIVILDAKLKKEFTIVFIVVAYNVTYM